LEEKCTKLILRYSGASVHERPCSRTIRFTNKFSEQKTSRITNGFSDYEHASWQKRQAESISAGVSCWLTMAQYIFLLDFVLRTFRFTNGLQERIKLVNRGPTVYGYDITWIHLAGCGWISKWNFGFQKWGTSVTNWAASSLQRRNLLCEVSRLVAWWKHSE
jgi:hypothetical protein